MVHPTQQTSTKRKRKSNDLIWARDGDHKNAQEHPCYLLENCNKDDALSNDNDDKVWVEWSSNGTVACISKSRISTTVLSRRRRTNNNNTKEPSVAGQPTTNNNTKKQKKHAPSKRSNNGQSKSNSTTATLNAGEDSESDDERIPDQILVEGCGIFEFNGTYRLDENIYLGSLVFIKRGEWKGEVHSFMIYRSGRFWYIGADFCHSYRHYKSAYITKADRKLKTPITVMPPLNGWRVMRSGADPEPTLKYKCKAIYSKSSSGSIRWMESIGQFISVDPAPTLKYKYDDAIDNSSSVSDSIKVKKDSAKVKEEMDGGETDDKEEDRKIAAVPSPVVSSQLTTSAHYDQDTDDDIAPDTVQSQVKVKEEAGEDTDDDAAPDPVQSTQVKQEPDEESTDDEGITPDQIQSTRVKTEEEETDDEGVSASAKENTTNGGSLDFSEAVEHEKTCNGRPSLSSSSDIDESEDNKDEDRKIAADDDSDDESISTWDSSNERYNETSKVYVWCEGQYYYEKEYVLVLFPYSWYLFWKKLKRCKTFGDIRKLCGKEHYYHFEERYKEKREYEYNSDSDEDSCNKKFNEEELTDDKSVCIGDFDLEECSDDDTPQVDMFPPPLEQVMWDGAASQKQHEWMLDYGEVTEAGNSGQCWLKFKLGDKDKIFKKIEELGCTVRHFPRLGEEFISIFQM